MNRMAVLLILAFSQPCVGAISYVNEIPDFTQTDVAGVAAGNGRQYCAPVAVSNSLAWFGGDEGAQLDIIKRLAGKGYMNTSLKNGTGTTSVLRGVDRISKELLGGYKTLEYEGWRKHPEKYSRGVKVPSVERMKSSISEKSAAWVNVGWYKYNKGKNEYRRIGGHWVTLVGSTVRQLVFHDPSPRAGGSFSNEFVEYRKLENGRLTGNKLGLPTSARGYVALGNGMHVKSGADVAIIDGVVYFEL